MICGPGHDSAGVSRHCTKAVVATLLVSWGMSVPASAAIPNLEETVADLRGLIIFGLWAGLTLFAIVISAVAISARNRARKAEIRAKERGQALDNARANLEALVTAEPQVLVHWGDEGVPRIKANTLIADLGVPSDLQKLLKLDTWLDRSAAGEVKSRLSMLTGNGSGFNVMSKTLAGSYVEIDGRASGGGTVLKVRDLAGRRQDLARVAEQHAQLGNEISALRSVLDAFPAPVWLRDARGKIEWVNRTYSKAVDAASAEQVLRDQIELLHSRSRQTAEKHLKESEIYRGQAEATITGRDKIYDTVILPLGAASAGFAMDTQGDESGDAANRLESYAQALNGVATGVAVFAPDERLIYFNEAYSALFALNVDWLQSHPRHGEVLDRLRAQSVLPEEANYREWKTKQLALGGGGAPADSRWHLPDGRSIRVSGSKRESGDATFFFEDVTERLALQSRYNSLSRVQKETLDKLREGVAVFATDGRLKLYNPSFSRIWSLDDRTLDDEPHIDQVIEWCRTLYDDDTVWDDIKRAVTSIDYERPVLERQLSRPDGSILAYSGLPLPDGAMLLTYVDITDTKRVEDALVERAQALEAADQLKNTFISHISYELRVPLTNIIGFAELLWGDVTGELNDKQREYVSDIRASSDTLLAIINDILDLATIDAGGLDLNLAQVDVQEVIDAAILGVRERLQHAGLDLDVEIAQDLSELIADQRRVTQVLYNLLSNAAGFSEEGGTIRIACFNDGSDIAISVSDEGIGIPLENQTTIFERFISHTHGTSHRGAGLGLSIVKSLVELHGGAIALESTPGEGTCVTVRFPKRQITVPTGEEDADGEAADTIAIPSTASDQDPSTAAA